MSQSGVTMLRYIGFLFE